jgi:ribosomal protein S18 acetylase RimI-like enzyme
MSFASRLMCEDDFTSKFELFVMETFFQDEPMNKYLNTKIPDEIDLPWLKGVLHKAKYDNLSLAFYDTKSHQSLPIAYAINHHDKINDINHSDILYSSINQTYLHKYEHINGLITKLHENINLFEKFHCKNLFHIYFLGVDQNYRENKLASQLIDLSICLAKEKNFDMIYADVTSDYSLKAFLKHNFQIIKTINYNSYENFYGEKIFQNIQIHKGCSIVIKDLRIK